MVSSGYLYMCAKDGNKTEGFTCAFTEGTAAQMTDNKKIGTVTTTSLKTSADFNKLVTGGLTPFQYVVDPALAGSVFSKKTCSFNDGAGGCWG